MHWSIGVRVEAVLVGLPNGHLRYVFVGGFFVTCTDPTQKIKLTSIRLERVLYHWTQRSGSLSFKRPERIS